MNTARSFIAELVAEAKARMGSSAALRHKWIWDLTAYYKGKGITILMTDAYANPSQIASNSGSQSQSQVKESQEERRRKRKEAMENGIMTVSANGLRELGVARKAPDCDVLVAAGYDYEVGVAHSSRHREGQIVEPPPLMHIPTSETEGTVEESVQGSTMEASQADRRLPTRNAYMTTDLIAGRRRLKRSAGTDSHDVRSRDHRDDRGPEGRDEAGLRPTKRKRRGTDNVPRSAAEPGPAQVGTSARRVTRSTRANQIQGGA